MFQLTLMGKSDAVIESLFINMHARCVQVLKNGSESRGFNLRKVKKETNLPLKSDLAGVAGVRKERGGELESALRAPHARAKTPYRSLSNAYCAC